MSAGFIAVLTIVLLLLAVNIITRLVLRFAKSLRARGRLNSWVARKIFPEKLLRNPEKYLSSTRILEPKPTPRSDIWVIVGFIILFALSGIVYAIRRILGY